MKRDWIELEYEDFGRYTLEVCINERTPGSHTYDYHGFIRFWEKKGRLPEIHDEMLYIHANPQCHGLLTTEDTKKILCPTCGLGLANEIGELFVFNCSLEALAKQLVEFYKDLNGDVNIRLTRYKVPHSTQQAALDPTQRPSDILKATDQVTSQNEDALYTKGRLSREAAYGNLYERILAFLRA